MTPQLKATAGAVGGARAFAYEGSDMGRLGLWSTRTHLRPRGPPSRMRRVQRTKILVGTCSWTDPTLVKETDWYPKKSMSAAERLAFYASRFAIAEADSTYYFPPTPQLTQGWAERTPA